MSNILYIEKKDMRGCFAVINDTIKVETEVDENGIMTITRTKNIGIPKFQKILENGEINNIREENGKIILDITTSERPF